MEKTLLVHVVQGLACLEHDVTDLSFWKGSTTSPFHEFVNVALHVLEHHMKNIVLSYYLLQLDNIGMVQLPQGFDLAEFHALVPSVNLLLHLFYCHHLAAILVLAT